MTETFIRLEQRSGWNEVRQRSHEGGYRVVTSAARTNVKETLKQRSFFLDIIGIVQPNNIAAQLTTVRATRRRRARTGNYYPFFFAFRLRIIALWWFNLIASSTSVLRNSSGQAGQNWVIEVNVV